jgi:hypothetical protein
MQHTINILFPDDFAGLLILIVVDCAVSWVFVGIWALHHDATRYPNHEVFNPDHYLDHPKLANEYAVSPDYNNRDKRSLLIS